jgi:transcription factor C subunit 7
MASMLYQDVAGGPQTIFVIRHGDRFDYHIGSDEWQKMAVRKKDPPLSDLGTTQAKELGAFFKELRKTEPDVISKIVTSPFLRCIQTADPIAGAFDVPLLIENSLWEIVYTSEVMPELEERKSYFPRVDTTYQSLFRPALDEDFPLSSTARYAAAAHSIVDQFRGERGFAMVTHAAGVVTIGKLVSCRLYVFSSLRF